MKVIHSIVPLVIVAIVIFVGAKLHLGHWIAISCWQMLTLVAGIFIAHRLGADLAFSVLSILLTGVVVELIAHLLYGIRTVQGGPTHLAIFAAATMGLLFGMLSKYTRRNSRAGASVV